MNVTLTYLAQLAAILYLAIGTFLVIELIDQLFKTGGLQQTGQLFLIIKMLAMFVAWPLIFLAFWIWDRRQRRSLEEILHPESEQ